MLTAQSQPPLVINGRYRLCQRLGSGASSQVFAVQDLLQGRARRALKLLYQQADEALLQAEFARLSRLDHPCLAKVYDLGRLQQPLAVRFASAGDVAPAPVDCAPAGQLFLVLDHIEGADPRQLRGALAEPELEPWLRQLAWDLASALDQLHGHGLVHSDLNPGNILVTPGGQAVLIDLGLSMRAGEGPAGRGTLPYLAPEALVEGADHRADLYSLGATLFELAQGRRPFDGQGAALVQQIFEERPTLSCPWISPSLRALVLRLLEKDPARRPASARSVLADLARMAGDQQAVAALISQPQLLPAALVGREAQLTALAEAFARGCAGQLQVIVLAAEPGLGKSRLLQEAFRRHQLAAVAGRSPQLDLVASAAHQLLDQTPEARSAALLAELDPASRQQALALLAADAVLQRASQGPCLIHLADLAADPLDQALVGVLLRDPEARGWPLVIVAEVPRQVALSQLFDLPEAEDSSSGPALLLRLDPLEQPQLGQLAASMLGRELPAAALERIWQLSAGHPALAQELIRRWHFAGDAALPLEGCALPDLVSRLRAALPQDQQQLADSLAVWGEPASLPLLAQLSDLDLAQAAPALEGLLSRAAVIEGRGQLQFPSPLHQRSWLTLIEGQLPAAALARLHLRAAQQLQRTRSPERIRRAAHLLAASAPGAAEEALAAGCQLAALGASARALGLLRGALAQGQHAVRQRAAPLLAQLLLLRGCYAEVLALEAQGSALELAKVQAHQRLGHYDAAEQLLRRLLVTLADPDQRCRAAALWGRALLQQGRRSEALEVLAPHLEALEGAAAEFGPGWVRLLETAGLAQLYAGQQELAQRLFTQGATAAQALADVVAQARFCSLHGMAALLAGELPAAAVHYRRALELSLQAGDAEAGATGRGNLGAVQLERGAWGEALALLAAAVRDLRRLGQSASLVGALCNQGNLLLLLGELAAAETLLGEAGRLAQALGDQRHGGYVQMLGGDLCRRRGQPGQAAERYAEAEATFAAAEASSDALLCRLARAECLAGQGWPEQADALAGEQPAQVELQGPWAMSRVQLALVVGTAAGSEVTQTLVAHCARLESRGALRDLWRAAVLLGAELHAQGRKGAARQALRWAKTARETIMEQTPEIYHEALDEDPDAAVLARQWRALLEEGSELEPPSEPGRAAAYDDRRLRKLMAINKRLNSELRLPRLLELILDTLIDLTEAERGFLLLRGEDERLEVKAARNIDRQSLEGEALAISRSIAEQAAASGEPVVTVDAAEDLRFQQAVSVSGLRLRSVLAVPLMVKGQTVGTVYVDSRLERSLFGAGEVRLVQDIADQAAIAIENARLMAENRRKASDIAQLNRQLKRKLRSQAVELVEVREELRSSRQALKVRYDYQNIVGQSPQMLELFRLLDRVTETGLPVVIQGESGTGKELVARAIHDNGPRAKRPFVSENCAAIPETLLESVLFGHVKGAFTGADRDRPGLFEVASGGTLFLDEVGEMSPAMQTKLLRVLQDGDLRRVGGNRVQRVDVRVIGASNRNLRELVKQGLFREDLFYRLNVVLIQLPPLRERQEDIPLLVEHLLHKHAGGQKTVSGPALTRLMAHHWPGNVRELENEIMRAIALGEQVIQPTDLTLPAAQVVSGALPCGSVSPKTLDLHAQVEQLERQLINQALAQTSGNHTHAAELLGLSRYGLLKKIKRYALAEE